MIRETMCYGLFLLLLVSSSPVLADSTTTLPTPTANLANPLNGDVISINDLFSFIDVTFVARGTAPIDEGTIADTADEFTLSGSGLGTLNTLSGASQKVTGATFRYFTTGAFSGPGPIDVSFAAGTFADTDDSKNEAISQAFTVTSLDADITNPVDEGFIDLGTLNGRGYLEVRYTSENALDLGSILDLDPEFQLEGGGTGGVAVDDESAEQVDNGSDTEATIRYPFLGAFTEGTVTVQFLDGGFTDVIGASSPTNAESFNVVPEPHSLLLVVPALLAVLWISRRAPGGPARG